MKDRIHDVERRALGLLEMTLSKFLLPDKKAPRDGGFSYVPKSNATFLWWCAGVQELLPHIKELERSWCNFSTCECRKGAAEKYHLKAHFLDVGGGIGTKANMATMMFGWDGHSLEFREPYVKFAQQIIGNRAILGDGRAYGHYDRFDVIYYYRPMYDPALQAALQRAVFEGAKERTIIISDGDGVFGQPSRIIHKEIPHIQIKTEEEGLVERLNPILQQFLNNHPAANYRSW